MLGTPAKAALASGVLLAGIVSAMALDPHGYRLWRRRGAELAQIQADNAHLSAQIATLQRRAVELREESERVDAAQRSGRKTPLKPGESPALERAAHENGFIRADETLFQLPQ